MDADGAASADEEHAIYGYAFAVGESPYCCWGWDLEKRNLEFGPMSGAALQKLIADSLTISPEVINHAIAMSRE